MITIKTIEIFYVFVYQYLRKKIHLIIIFQECIYNNEQQVIKYFSTCHDFVVSLTS